MRKYVLASGLVIAAGLGAYVAIGAANMGQGPTLGRLERLPRYGGRASPIAVTGLTIAACTSGKTNTCLQSQTFNSATWTKSGGGGSTAPTVTANAGVAPDGTTTADRVQFNLTALNGYSVIYQAGACPNATASSAGVYYKAFGANCTTYFCHATVTNTENCVAFTATSTWQRFTDNNRTASSDRTIYIGNLSYSTGVPGTAACDVLLWQADCQDSTTLGGPILTTTDPVICP